MRPLSRLRGPWCATAASAAGLVFSAGVRHAASLPTAPAPPFLPRAPGACPPFLRRSPLLSSGLLRGGARAVSAAPTAGLTCARRFQSSNTEDYYASLGVAPTATQDEIKSAYKKLALQYHPDRNHEPGAEEKFKTISAAYNVIGHKDRRREYDMQRAAFSSRGGGGGGMHSSGFPSSGGQHGGFPRGGGYREMSKDEADRLFREIFGGMRVDQIFRDLEEEMRRSSASSRSFTNAGPFFRQSSQSTNVFTDAFGNRMEEHVFTDPTGRRFTVHRATSADPNASMNQTKEDYNSAHTNRGDGRVHFGRSSHNYSKPNMDWTQQYMGFRSHGRTPLIAFLSLGAWFIVLSTLASCFFYLLFSHPIFSFAVLFLIFAGRRGRF